jgi:cell division septal protein FtsQ
MAKQRRLRKQPKKRRIKATGTSTIPRIVIPKTAKNRRRRNHRRLKMPTFIIKNILTSSRWLSLALLAVSIYALITIGQDTSYFLTNIPVSGNITISSSDIVASSGLAGTHVFAANPGNAADRIGQLPGVISAKVILQWPNQVSISIVEDKPVAVWKQNGKTYLIAESGELVPVRYASPHLLLIQTEIDQSSEIETYVPADVLQGALALRELRPNIDQLFYRPGSGLSYQDGRGWRAYFGSGTEMAQKLVVYETIVEELIERAESPSYISVRNQAKPYYMTSGG